MNTTTKYAVTKTRGSAAESVALFDSYAEAWEYAYDRAALDRVAYNIVAQTYSLVRTDTVETILPPEK